VLFFTLILISASRAANFVVVTNSDSGPGSLRQAILGANASGGGTITFSNVTGAIDLLSGLPVLTANITISGPGASELTLTNSNRLAISILTNSAGSTGAITGITISGTLDNYGTLHMENSLVGNQLSPGRPGLYNSGTTTLARCTFTANRNMANADAIENDGTMTIDHCSITNNRGGDGSIYNTGTLTMDNSIVSGHTYFTSSAGGLVNQGGIVVLRNCTMSHNDSVEGGGVWNGGSLAVTNCLISYNSARYSEPGEVGGGLYNIGYAILQNTTISGNSAQGAGGGIWNGGSMRLLNCTVSSNTAIHRLDIQSGGGGIWTDNRAISQSKNSIIAGNRSYDTNWTLIADDISGSLESFGHDLVLDTNGWPQAPYSRNDLLGVDPRLGPLQDNGGPTWTHALLPGSPAIDAGDATGAPGEDQRGVTRPQGPNVDIGAFELQYPISPLFTRIEVQFNTNLLLKAYGVPLTSYTLQASQDFVSWDSLATLTASSNGVVQFSDPIICPRRFYRLELHLPEQPPVFAR